MDILKLEIEKKKKKKKKKKMNELDEKELLVRWLVTYCDHSSMPHFFQLYLFASVFVRHFC